jgi:hypothetical protein
MMDRLQKRQYWEATMRQSRYAEAKRLVQFGWKAYCQNDEDGIIAEIFTRIGVTSRRFVEIGVSVLENNTLALLLQGWTGAWIDGNQAHEAWAREYAGHLFADDELAMATCHVDVTNINTLIADNARGMELDLLSIDVDGNDYWLFEAVTARPRVCVLEYNATWHPPISVTQPYDPSRVWDGTNYMGASLSALTSLAARKGYRLVGCSFAGVNAFFVAEELCGDRFLSPYTAANHYEPARYDWADQSGHAPGIGPLVRVG